MATTFTGLDPYKLSGVNVTDRILGRGAYATVVELEYMGLKCAGKKIHELLLAQGNTSYAIHHFQKECQLMSRLHHPNIVQFLGVYFQSNTQVPILVMEYLPTNLTSCIEDYGVLPSEIGYPILHGVALGLCFLHNQIPPVIHRDLSSNNVLLNSNLTAKVSDLGVARILNMNRMQASRMTQIPGTPAYMPPETMGANPDYSASVDIFSYGVMIIHVLSGQWPEPQGGQIRIDGDKLIPVSEAERRSTFLEAIGKDHSLMKLILQCISNNPQLRPVTNVIVKQLAELVKECSSDVSNQLDRMVRSRTESEIDSEGRNRAETMRSGCIRRRPVYKVKAPSSMELDTPKEATIVRRQLSDSAMPVTSNKVSSSPGSEETVVGSDGAGKMRGSPGLVSKLSKELELSIVSKQGTVTDEKQSISPSSLEEREPESAVSQKVHAANYINIQTMCLGDVHKAPQESSSPLPPIHSSLGSEETVGTGSGEAVKVHRSPGFVKKLSKELEPFIAPKQDTVIIEKSKISLSHIKEDHEVVPVTTISQNVDAAEYENPITPSSHHDSLHKGKVVPQLSSPSLPVYPICIANYDYCAKDSTELSFKKGDMLAVMHNKEMWWLARSMDTGKEGLIPGNYVNIPLDDKEMDHCQIELVKRIGTGRFSVVWEGVMRGKYPVAVKVLNPEKRSSVGDFLKKATMIKVLSHPHVVHLSAVCTKKTPIYLVYELMKHGNLLKYLRNEGRSLCLPQLIKMASQCAEGMAFLEGQGYVHRDVAARSVLVGEKLNCKLANFHLAHVVHGEFYKAPGEDKVAIKWTAPEAAMHNQFTIKSDVWSFGVLIFEIITHGRFPYPSMTNAQVFEQVRQGFRMPKPMDCPPRLYAVMLNCWTEEPKYRPTFKTLQQQLMEVLI